MLKESKKIIFQEELTKLLVDREKRTELLKDLLDQKKVVITLTLNVPGVPKIDAEKRIFLKNLTADFLAFLNPKFPVLKILNFEDTAGGISYLVFYQVDPVLLKKQTLLFEKKLGAQARLLDIDVYFQNLKKVSRQDLKVPGQKCFLCPSLVQVCRVKKTHSLSELRAYFDKLMVEERNLKPGEQDDGK